MQKFKTFPLIDALHEFKNSKLTRITQLFLISLIACYHEKQRSSGKIIDENINQKRAIYKIRISDKEINRKFGFSIDTIIKIKKEINEKDFPIDIQFIEIVSVGKKYKRYSHHDWSRKYLNEEHEYSFDLRTEGKNLISIPTKVIYEKKENLSYSNKLAIIWNLCLKEKNERRQPKLKEVGEASGISVKTIGDAKKKYPQLFTK